MRGSPHSTRRTSPALPQLGLERVTWVRILLDPAGNRCEVAGVGHRRPVLRRVPLRTATALLAGGVPGVVRSSSSPVAPAAGAGRPVARGDVRQPVFICHCRAVTDGAIRGAIEAGAHDPRSLSSSCGAGSRCGGCWPALQSLLAEYGLGPPGSEGGGVRHAATHAA